MQMESLVRRNLISPIVPLEIFFFFICISLGPDALYLSLLPRPACYDAIQGWHRRFYWVNIGNNAYIVQ